jgi:hypothetical protein
MARVLEPALVAAPASDAVWAVAESEWRDRPRLSSDSAQQQPLPLRHRSVAATLKGGDRPRLVMRLEPVLDLSHARHRFDCAQQRRHFVREDGTAETDGSVARVNVDCPRMRNGAPKLGAHALDQDVIGRPIGAESATRFLHGAHRSIRPIARNGIEPITGLVGHARELIPHRRPSPAPHAWIECVHTCRAKCESNHERRVLVHELPFQWDKP